MKLLPCPFCGANPNAYKKNDRENYIYIIECDNEDCLCAARAISFLSMEGAIEDWSKRNNELLSVIFSLCLGKDIFNTSDEIVDRIYELTVPYAYPGPQPANQEE